MSVVKIEPGPDAPKQAQTAMIKARPGETIEFGAGKFEFVSTLSLDVDHVTIRGQGPDKTIFSFKNQGQGTGGEGLLVTGKEDVTVEDLAVEDAKGDAIKVNGTKGLFFRNVRAEWTGGPKETNGGYGLYPVLCTDVLIEGCTVMGASDAGIYVGQSREHHRPSQHGRAERRRHRDRELHPGRRLREHRDRQFRRHPGLHDARPAHEGRPSLPRLQEHGPSPTTTTTSPPRATSLRPSRPGPAS